MRVQFNELGASFGNRNEAKKIRSFIEEKINMEEIIIFDFDGVELITSSFADECFGKLIQNMGLNFIRSKTKFVNTNKNIDFVIKSSINKRLLMNKI